MVKEKGGNLGIKNTASKVLTQGQQQRAAGQQQPMFGSNRAVQQQGTGHRWKPKMATPTQTTAQYQASMAPSSSASVSAPNPAPAPAPTPAPVTVQQPQQKALKHTQNEISDLRKALAQAGIDQATIDAYTDQDLDDLWDDLVE